MGQEFSIARQDRSPIGDPSTVWEAVAVTLPGVHFTPPLSEPGPRSAYYYGEDFLIMLGLNPSPPFDGIEVQVRGPGDPVPALRRLTEANGWVLKWLGAW
jgi:hypothetical protein